MEEALYKSEDRKRILKSFLPKHNFMGCDFLERVEVAASVLIEARQAVKANPVPAASSQARNWNSLARRLNKATAAVEKLSNRSYSELLDAADAVARQENSLPDFESEQHELPPLPSGERGTTVPIWHLAAEQQVEKTVAEISWLARVVTEAAIRAEADTAEAGSRRPDEYLHSFVRLVNLLYRENAADPRNPGADIGDMTSESGTHREGEILDLIDACIRPLGIKLKREAIYSLWRRSVANTPKKRDPHTRKFPRG